MDKKQAIQHVQLPNQVVQTKGLNSLDVLVYCFIKSFDGPDGCFPSIRAISERSNLSHNFIIKSIKNLVKSKWLIADCAGKGHKTYYKFLKFDYFEPFSFTFLCNNELSSLTKSYLICNQQDLFKQSEDAAYMIKTANEISSDINMPLSSVYKCEDELKDKGILTITKLKNIDPVLGTKKQLRKLDLSKYNQEIAYTLRHMNDKIDANTKDIIELREDNAKTRSEMNAMRFMLKEILIRLRDLDKQKSNKNQLTYAK